MSGARAPIHPLEVPTLLLSGPSLNALPAPDGVARRSESQRLRGRRRGKESGDEVDEVADEQPVVGVGAGVGTAGELDDGEAEGDETAMQSERVDGQKRRNQVAPAEQAVFRVVERGRVEHRLRAIHQLGHDLEVGAAAIAELYCERLDERVRERPQVGLAIRLVGVEHRMAASVDVEVVLLEDRAHEPRPVAEVVLERGRVAGTGRAHDLPQADGLDAVRGEQLLGCRDEPVPGVDRRSHPPQYSKCIDK